MVAQTQPVRHVSAGGEESLDASIESSRLEHGAGGARSAWTRRLAVALVLWAAWYAAYRLYYAFGGHVGMVGRPAPVVNFRHNNLVGGIIILLAAAGSLVALWGWRRPVVGRLVVLIGWVAAVGCCMHALTLEVLRILSLTGIRPMHYPPGVWLSIDRQRADLQDALFNEPWFFIEGFLWALFALTAVRPASRRLWQQSALAATLLALAIGLLSAMGVIPALRAG